MAKDDYTKACALQNEDGCNELKTLSAAKGK